MKTDKKITNSQLKELLKNNSVRKIIYMYVDGIIKLNSKQLDYLLNLEHEIL